MIVEGAADADQREMDAMDLAFLKSPSIKSLIARAKANGHLPELLEEWGLPVHDR